MVAARSPPQPRHRTLRVDRRSGDFMQPTLPSSTGARPDAQWPRRNVATRRTEHLIAEHRPGRGRRLRRQLIGRPREIPTSYGARARPRHDALANLRFAEVDVAEANAPPRPRTAPPRGSAPQSISRASAPRTARRAGRARSHAARIRRSPAEQVRGRAGAGSRAQPIRSSLVRRSCRRPRLASSSLPLPDRVPRHVRVGRGARRSAAVAASSRGPVRRAMTPCLLTRYRGSVVVRDPALTLSSAGFCGWICPSGRCTTLRWIFRRAT